MHKQFAIQQLKGSALTSAFAALQRDWALAMATLAEPKHQPYTCFPLVSLFFFFCPCWMQNHLASIYVHAFTLHFVVLYGRA